MKNKQFRIFVQKKLFDYVFIIGLFITISGILGYIFIDKTMIYLLIVGGVFILMSMSFLINKIYLDNEYIEFKLIRFKE